MTRIYDNKPLSALTVDNVEWKKQWQPETYQKGEGVLIEGVIKGRSRHTINDPTMRVRYFVFYVAVRRAHRRKYAADRSEIEPNFSETEKV